jgi:histidinol-phosphate aminotransferase
MPDINKLVRENVKRLTPYSSARDDYSGSTGIFLDANENPFGNLNRYPDPYQHKLKSALIRLKGVNKESVFLGNGSDEIIDLAFRVFCNPGTDKAMIFPPTYGMYEVSAYVNDIEVIKVPLNIDFQIDIKKAAPFLKDPYLKLIFICSPNNPTGNSMNSESIDYIIQNFKGIVVLDEAYSDFSEKPSFITMVDRYPNLIVMQTFSKALGLAAARIGIAFSNPDILQYFNRIKPPYNISTINQQAALHKLSENIDYMDQVEQIKTERERLKAELLKLRMTENIFPSDANFLLVKVKDANFIYNYLVNNNIIVRNRSSMVSNCLRITVGTIEENDKLIEALKKVII